MNEQSCYFPLIQVFFVGWAEFCFMSAESQSRGRGEVDGRWPEHMLDEPVLLQAKTGLIITASVTSIWI